MRQNCCPSIHLLFYPATAQDMHIVPSLGIPACYYVPTPDHPHHPMQKERKKYKNLGIVQSEKNSNENNIKQPNKNLSE